MPLLATITFASSMLEDNNFFAPLLRRNLGFDPHTSNRRRANRHLCTLPDKLYTGQCDCVANSAREFFHINRVAWADAILPTTRRHNCIHILSFSPHWRHRIRLGAGQAMQKVSGERTTCRRGLSSEAASRHTSLLHLAHGPHSVYSNFCSLHLTSTSHDVTRPS